LVPGRDQAGRAKQADFAPLGDRRARDAGSQGGGYQTEDYHEGTSFARGHCMLSFKIEVGP